MAEIELRQVAKKFGEAWAVKPMDLTIHDGEFVALLGPSGCGKTTTLRMISGLEAVTEGRITIDGKDVTWLTASQRDIAFVFQQYAVFPWMTVKENVQFGLRLAANRCSPDEMERTAEHFIDLVNLRDFKDAYPKQLSGGMKQRVAIARAYAVNPKVLLMDEPFGALDAQTRHFMQESLLQILEKERKTVVFVTHGVEEAAFLSTRVVIMAARPGRVREIIPIDLPYPRDAATKTSPEFIKIRAVIETVVREEFQKLRSAEGAQ
jgi:NitT/TauT family transport system ATP-binding protein